MGPLIAILGSADSARNYDPPLRNADLAPGAAASLGKELAIRGCRLIVYSGKAGFIEADVVRGYVASGSAVAASIQVRAPIGSHGAEFAEAKTDRELFDPRPDTSGDWEVAFYRSLVETDAVLLIGGGRSTFITGLISIALKIPTVSVAAFGGAAEKVWQALDRVRNDATDDDIAAMAGDWHASSARVLVDSLLNQRDHRARDQEQRRQQQRQDDRRAAASLAAAAVLLLVGLATIPAVYAWQPGTGGNLVALLAAPILVAPSGAIVRNTLDEGRHWWRTAVLGMIAGAISGLLFVVAQLAATPDVLDGAAARRLLLFIVPVGFIAGLTFDAVYTKLRSEPVADTKALHLQ
jgi:hypothetical protein